MINIRENNFDIVRLLLAVLVGFAHWNFLTGYNSDNFVFSFSKIAVDSFFIISGFLIYWSYDNNTNIKFFYIKRFFRIFPIYLILIVLQTLFFFSINEVSFIDIFKYFMANIVFLNFLAPSVGSTFESFAINAINGSLWTLKNEVLFYLFLPVFYFIYKKMGFIIWIGLYLLSIIYLFIFSYLDIDKMLVQFPGQLRLFVIGIILYVMFKKFNTKNLSILFPFALLSLIIFKDYEVFTFVFYPILLGFVVLYFVYSIYRIKINFDFSYSFYILHFPLIQIFIYYEINPDNPLLSFGLIFFVVFLLSYLSEIYIENGFIKVGRKIIDKYKEKTS